MYDRIRIVSNAQSSRKIMGMFAESFAKIKKHNPKAVKYLPTVVSK